MSTNQNPNEHHKSLFDFYVCFNDVCSYFGENQKRSAGDFNMRKGTVPTGYYQGNPICKWCDVEMDIAHTDNQANPPHIEWDGTLPITGELYYQLKF